MRPAQTDPARRPAPRPADPGSEPGGPNQAVRPRQKDLPMSAPARIRRLAAAFGLALVASTGVAAAATLTESAQAGGAFSGLWNSPTQVGAGFDTVAGTGGQNAYDTFVFTALPRGAQSLTLDFSAPAGLDSSYSAGGAILWSETPFRWGWDGQHAGTVQVDHGQPSQSLTLNLANSFGGTLYLALNFTHGRDLAYTLSAPSNGPAPAPAPVPLPAGVWLIGVAMATLGAVGWRKARCSLSDPCPPASDRDQRPIAPRLRPAGRAAAGAGRR